MLDNIFGLISLFFWNNELKCFKIETFLFLSYDSSTRHGINIDIKLSNKF